mgnify:FL=1
MLVNLHIKNMALIDEIEIDFSNHLNILTGETGAGKSIVIDSIMLALGGKTPKDFVRADADYGLVELIFLVEDKETIQKLQELEVMDVEQGQLILSRKIIGNRSISKVNGETVTLTKVREISSLLLDLHAQHEHQSLLVPQNHLKILDRYGGKDIADLKHEVSVLNHEYKELLNEYRENSMDEEEKVRQLDLMEFEMKEIQAANLKIGEDDELEEQYKIAANGKNITDGLMTAYGYLENDASQTIDRAIREITTIADYDDELGKMSETLMTVSELITDFNRSARNYLDDHTFSEEEFRQMEERLNTLNHLKTKYGKTLQSVLDYEQDLSEKYEKLMHQEQYLNNLEKRVKEKEKQLKSVCRKLSEYRKQVAKGLTQAIKNALIDLNFLDVRFDMVFEQLDHYLDSGFDYAYFIISTNIGEEMKPLWQVASGGELSRIMLAMKSQLADSDGIETLIFDEIDVGISGRTAQMVAEKIHAIGQNHQVICITHLPQIAAMANHHYKIEKKVCGNKTITNIEKLNKEQEISELARLIGGVKITDTVLESAREMKELASKAKVN